MGPTESVYYAGLSYFYILLMGLRLSGIAISIGGGLLVPPPVPLIAVPNKEMEK
tara:strand:- start:2944 stop:3105 length:162 start_codon:yes stop_codon:yes gene_type:complete